MLRIGRYGIAFGRDSFRRISASFIQRPFKSKHFLCFWLLKEARPTDVDKEQQFLSGTPMEYEGRRYLYWGPAPRDIARGQAVFVTPENFKGREGD